MVHKLYSFLTEKNSSVFGCVQNTKSPVGIEYFKVMIVAVKPPVYFAQLSVSPTIIMNPDKVPGIMTSRLGSYQIFPTRAQEALKM